MPDLIFSQKLIDIFMNNGLAVALVVFFIATTYFKDKASADERKKLDELIRVEFLSLIKSTSVVAEGAAEAVRNNTAQLAAIAHIIRGCEYAHYREGHGHHDQPPL